jgi:hypothetical protein
MTHTINHSDFRRDRADAAKSGEVASGEGAPTASARCVDVLIVWVGSGQNTLILVLLDAVTGISGAMIVR